MKNKLLLVMAMLFIGILAFAQEVDFEEYDLNNGLHIILHQDKCVLSVCKKICFSGFL